MKINSEQEMLDFGKNFAKWLRGEDSSNSVFRDISRPTGSELARSPVTTAAGAEQTESLLSVSRRRPADDLWSTGATKRVEKDTIELSKATVIELIGDIGAGKTTFVRGLAEGLGIKEPVTSPSFTISKSYALPDDKYLIHYDFYRLPDSGLMANHLREAINSNSIVIIEWGKSVENILPKNRIIISIELDDNESRKVVIKDNRNSIFRDISRPTGSELARSPVTTGATKRVEKGAVRLFLDTSTPETILRLDDHEYRYTFANDLAEKLLKFIHDKLEENGKSWHDISEVTFMSGPGSFTGLRIGASIVNTLAHELNIPLYDHNGKKHQIILPDYGRPAHITAPKK